MSGGITEPTPGSSTEGTESGELVTKVLDLKSQLGATQSLAGAGSCHHCQGRWGKGMRWCHQSLRARAAVWGWGHRGDTVSAGNAA